MLWVFFAFESGMRARYLGDWVEALSEDEENEFVATLEGLRVLPRHLWRRPQFDFLSEPYLRNRRNTVQSRTEAI
jgi:hypothetical protein